MRKTLCKRTLGLARPVAADGASAHLRSPAALRAFALCVAVTVPFLCGCGSSGEPESAAAPQASSAKAKHATAPADPTADMIAAVSGTKAPPQVKVKFALSTRPQPGEPLQVDLALIPLDPDLLLMTAKFDGEDGLTLITGGAPLAVEKPAAQVAIKHTVTVVPKADGIYALRATVTTGTDGDSKTAVFSIPVIAGNGLPALAMKSETRGKRPSTP